MVGAGGLPHDCRPSRWVPLGGPQDDAEDGMSQTPKDKTGQTVIRIPLLILLALLVMLVIGIVIYSQT